MRNSIEHSNVKAQPRTVLELRSLALVAAFVLCISVSGLAQDAGTILGTVTDTSGAVIPGVKVTVTNSEKAVNREVTSSSSGEYVVPKIPLGNYTVTAEAHGFQKLLRTGIFLDAGQTLKVDLQLTLGQVTQEITVSGEVQRVNTESGAVNTVITAKQVTDLNLNGRNFTALTMLVPGAASNNAFDSLHMGFGSGQERISFNGSRENDVNVEVDGGNNNDEWGGGRNVVTFPNIDAIQEFSITTSNYGADVGKRNGALVQVVTKGGTKDFHGTAFEFVRNNDLDANDYFVNRIIHPASAGANFNAPKQPVKWNLFGYNIGGPVYIPGGYNADKTKTFFFWSESWARYREGNSYGVTGPVLTANTPTLRMRQGDFSECDPASANYVAYVASGCVIPKNPANGLPMDTLAGAGYAVDPNATAILNGLIPLPNNGLLNGFVDAPNLPNNYRQEDIRVDQNVGTKTSMFGRFTQENHQFLATGGTYDTLELHYGLTSKSATYHIIYNIKSNLLNEVIVGWENDWQHYNTQAGPTSPAKSLLKPSTWTAGTLFAANKTVPAGIVLPYVTVSGGTPDGFTMASSGLNNINTYHPSMTVKDNVIYNIGKMNLKMGIYLLDSHATDYTSTANYPQGVFNFNTGSTLTTGDGLADMLLGRIASYGEGSPIVGGKPIGGFGLVRDRMKSFEPYFQDDWKITRRLTINLGVRWQYRWGLTEGSHPTQATDFYPAEYSRTAAATLGFSPTKSIIINRGTGSDYTSYGNGLVQCGSGGTPTGCINPYYGAFGPRFGFAYDPKGDGKTAIRGGFGVFYDVGYGHTPGPVASAGGPPTTLSPTISNIDGYTNITGGLIGPVGFNAWDPKERRPMINNYNLTIEHEFTGNNVFTLAYVGMFSRRLDASRNINQIGLNATTMNVPALAGTSGCDSSGNCNVQAILIHQAISEVNFFRPFLDYGQIRFLNDTGTSNYNSLQATYRHTFGHGLTVSTAYTWEHSLDLITDGTTTNATDYLSNLERWYSNGDLDRRQLVQASYVYDLPFFRNHPNHFVRNGIGGWHLSGISSFFTGVPVDFSCTESGYQTGIGTSGRCNTGNYGIAKGTITDSRYGSVPQWFDPAQITMASLSQMNADGAPGMFGYMARNALHGPGRNDFDMALLKDFGLPWFRGEQAKLQFRFETYNTFNHTQFKTINASCSSTTPFGSNCSGPTNGNLGNGEVASAWQPRQIQLGLKFVF